MTQRDLDRLRRGEITEMPVPVVNLPPEPAWEEIRQAAISSDPNLVDVERGIKDLLEDLSELRRQYEESITATLNVVAAQLRAIKRESDYRDKRTQRMLDDARKAYETLESKFIEQVQKTAEASQQIRQVRKTHRPPPPRPPQRKAPPTADCWARSAEPAGKLNCGCQGAPVAYRCEHPRVGGLVTLNTAVLRDTLLRRPDGVTEEIGTKHLPPCSICQYRGTEKEAPALISSVSLVTRETLCEACQKRTICPIPGSPEIQQPGIACPDGFWPAEAT